MDRIFKKIDNAQNAHIVREKIQMEIRSAICNNLLKSGEKIVESSIAKAFGVSRTPIREALRLLEYEGFVITSPNKGAIVTPLDVVSALKFFDIREVLAGLAAKLTCQRITGLECTELTICLEDMETAYLTGNHSLNAELYRKWATKIIAYSGNEFLLKQWMLCAAYISRFKKFQEYNLSSGFFIVELEEILWAFKSGDAKLSEKAAHLHVRNDRERFVAFYQATDTDF